MDVLGCQNEQYRVVASFLIKLVQDESNDLIRDVEREHQPLLLPSKKITDNYYSYLDDVPVVSYYGRRKVHRSKDEEKVSTPEELYEKWSSMPEERNTPTEPFLGMGIDHLVPKNSAFDMENEVVDLPRRK